MELATPLVNHLSDVMIGEACQRRLIGDQYHKNYKYCNRTHGILTNMTYFLNKYRTGFPVADQFFYRCLRDFKEIADVAKLHFDLPTCELMIVQKSKLHQLKGKHLLKRKAFESIQEYFSYNI